MKLSVAMCTCNGEAYLDEQLRSIAEQTQAPDELVVCDDASSDCTLDILRSFAASSAFPATITKNSTRLGVTRNFEQAIQKCQGDLIAPADQDDVWLPDKLQTLCSAFNNKSIGLVFSDAVLCDSPGRESGRTQWQRLGFTGKTRARFEHDPFAQLLRYNVVTGMSMMFRADLRPKLLPIPDTWVHDEWIALIAAAVSVVRPVDRVLARYRQHGGQQIGGVGGPLDQWRHARGHMDAQYMVRQSERATQAYNRLAALKEHLINGDEADLLKDMADYYADRVRPSPALILRQVFRGNYHRFGYGWKDLMLDLTRC